MRPRLDLLAFCIFITYPAVAALPLSIAVLRSPLSLPLDAAHFLEVIERILVSGRIQS